MVLFFSLCFVFGSEDGHIPTFWFQGPVIMTSVRASAPTEEAGPAGAVAVLLEPWLLRRVSEALAASFRNPETCRA